MKRGLRIVGVLFASVVVLSAITTVGFLSGWHIKKHTPEELAPLLKPHFRIKRPLDGGPSPTVVGFHGCYGVNKRVRDWADYLVELGYATIMVDSYTGRGFTPDDVEDVCAGRKFWGSERAGDVLVSLNEIRKLSFVDKNQLVLIGWSHGAWTIMDLLALDPPRNLPTNLSRSPDQPLAGVKAIILFYPYCEFPAKARRRGWTHDIRVLLLIAGRDSIVSSEACLEIVSILENKGQPITVHVYPSVDHAFDMREEDLKGSQLLRSRDATSDAQRRIMRFLIEALHSP